MPEMSAPSISAVSSSRAGRRPCLKTFALPEDPTPRIPWRVLSLPVSVVARENGQEATPYKNSKIEFVSSDDNSGMTITTTTRLVNGENTAVCWMRSSNGAPAAVLVGGRSFVNGETCSRSSKPSKRTLTGLGLIVDDESSCGDSASAARTRTEMLGAASWERETSARKILQVAMPSIAASDTGAAHSPCLAAAPPAVDVARCDRREEWRATPPIKAHGVANCRLHLQGGVKTANASNALASEVRGARKTPRVPKAPPRPLCAFEVLRQRTLKATLRDPSIFRRNFQRNLESEAGEVPETMQPTGWHILNRRIFGVGEAARRGIVAFPEWMMFSAGVPPSGLDEKSRWALRLGRNRKTLH